VEKGSDLSKILTRKKSVAIDWRRACRPTGIKVQQQSVGQAPKIRLQPVTN